MTQKVSSAEPVVPATERMLGLSDALFGIAITFLALDLSDLPKNLADLDNAQVGEFLRDNATRYAAYGFAFLVVGYQWWRHHWIFRYIKRRSDGLLVLNSALLCLVALIPYATTLLGDGVRTAPAAVAVFAVLMIAIALVLWGLWELALHLKFTIPNLDHRVLVSMRAHLMATPVAFGVTFVLAMVAFATASPMWEYAAVASMSLIVVAGFAVAKIWPPPSGIVEAEIDSDDSEAKAAAADPARSLMARLRHGSATDRITVFTDGVFAVAFTILALRIVAPDLEAGEHLTNEMVWKNLTSQGNVWWAYLVTFYVLALSWQRHVHLYDRILATDSVMLWLNLSFLMVVAFLPLPMDLITQTNSRWAFILYALAALLSGVTLSALDIYACHGARATLPIDETTVRYRWARRTWTIATYVLALILVIVLPSPGNGMFALLLLALMDPVLARRFPDADRD